MCLFDQHTYSQVSVVVWSAQAHITQLHVTNHTLLYHMWPHITQHNNMWPSTCTHYLTTCDLGIKRNSGTIALRCFICELYCISLSQDEVYGADRLKTLNLLPQQEMDGRGLGPAVRAAKQAWAQSHLWAALVRHEKRPHLGKYNEERTVRKAPSANCVRP